MSNKYKVEIKFQEREYETQHAAKQAAIDLLQAGVFNMKLIEAYTEVVKGATIKKPKIILKGEVTTFASSDAARDALIGILKTNNLFFVETHIVEDNN